MGGIVTNLWKKEKNIQEDNKENERLDSKEKDEEKNTNNNKNNNNNDNNNDNKEENNQISNENEKEKSLILKQKNETDNESIKLDSKEGNLLNNDEKKVPEKPIDLIFTLDLYCDNLLILNHIKLQLMSKINIDAYSNEFKTIFLEKSNTKIKNKIKILKFPKFIYNPMIHLKQLKHQWMKPFTTYIQNQKVSLLYIDANFGQISTFKQINQKYLKKVSILNVSENRISLIDIINVLYPISPTSSTSSLIPSNPKESDLQEVKDEADLKILHSNNSNNSHNSDKLSLKVSPSSSVLIPTPFLYNQLMYLNISSNLLFSLYGIQCCPNLKCLIASDNMITSLWPLIHLHYLEYLNLARNQLTSILDQNDLTFIRQTKYNFLSSAQKIDLNTRISSLPDTITYLDVSYNNNLTSLEGIEPLVKLIHLNASNCCLNTIQPISQKLFLSFLDVNTNSLSDLKIIYQTLQTLPSITKLYLYNNPFFLTLSNHDNDNDNNLKLSQPTLLTPSNLTLSSYPIMMLHLYSNQLVELDLITFYPSDYKQFERMLIQINNENIVNLLMSENQQKLYQNILHYNRLKSFHQQTENLLNNKIKNIQREMNENLVEQVEFIKKYIKTLQTVKNLSELYNLEEIKDMREKLIEKGILQEKECKIDILNSNKNEESKQFDEKSDSKDSSPSSKFSKSKRSKKRLKSQSKKSSKGNNTHRSILSSSTSSSGLTSRSTLTTSTSTSRPSELDSIKTQRGRSRDRSKRKNRKISQSRSISSPESKSRSRSRSRSNSSSSRSYSSSRSSSSSKSSSSKSYSSRSSSQSSTSPKKNTSHSMDNIENENNHEKKINNDNLNDRNESSRSNSIKTIQNNLINQELKQEEDNIIENKIIKKEDINNEIQSLPSPTVSSIFINPPPPIPIASISSDNKINEEMLLNV